jgi:hypothetical protein
MDNAMMKAMPDSHKGTLNVPILTGTWPISFAN